jgi:hypothetical protein
MLVHLEDANEKLKRGIEEGVDGIVWALGEVA